MLWGSIGESGVSDLIIIIIRNYLVVQRSEPGWTDPDILASSPVIEVAKLAVASPVIILVKPITILELSTVRTEGSQSGILISLPKVIKRTRISVEVVRIRRRRRSGIPTLAK